MASRGARPLAHPAPSFLMNRTKRDRAYAPSYDWGSQILNGRHDRIWDGLWRIPGWLTREDAQKLYELAFFVDGPILEIGTYAGRSAVAMALALADAENDHGVISLDTDEGAVGLGARSARSYDVADRISFVCAPALRFLRACRCLRPRLIFVDGDHSARGVAADLAAIEPVVSAGTLLLFHDYFPDDEIPDSRGFPISPGPIEVRDTVEASWVRRRAEYAGAFGLSALYRLRA